MLRAQQKVVIKNLFITQISPTSNYKTIKMYLPAKQGK